MRENLIFLRRFNVSKKNEYFVMQVNFTTIKSFYD